MKKKTSIKSQLTWLLVYCWIVPVLAISAVCVMYIQTAVKDRAEGNLRSGAAYAAQMSAQGLESAIQQMRSVISEGAVAKHYRERQDQNALTATVRGELLRKFGLQKEYLFSGVFFSDDPGRVVYQSPYGGAYLDAYLKDAHAQVVSALDEEDTDAHLLVSGRSVYLYQNLLDNRDLARFGVIVIQLDPAAVFDAFYSLDPAADHVLLSLNGQPYWLGGEPAEGRLREERLPSARQALKIGALRGYITATAVQREQNYELGYRVYLNDRIVTEKAYMVLLLAVVLACVVLPLLGAGFYRIYENIAGPIDALTVATERIENEQWDTVIPPAGDNNEFGRLIHSFNSMSARIKYLFDYAYKEELAASESRLALLQSQMNPQFLKNTLGLIDWKARLGGNEEVSRMIGALNNLLDASLENAQQRSVPLRSELGYTRSYLFIISERFGRRLTIGEHVDESLLSCPVPRLIIQPLIENAVVHGIEPAGGGRIEICIGKLEGKLAIEILNDGSLSDEDLRRIRAILGGEGGAPDNSQSRLGLKNVCERLRLMYGDKGSLTLQRTPDGWTRTRILIPLAQEGGADGR